MQNEELIEKLAGWLTYEYGINGEGTDDFFLDDADRFISDLGLNDWLPPETLRARLASLVQNQARAEQALRNLNQQAQDLAQIITQIDGAKAVLQELLGGASD